MTLQFEDLQVLRTAEEVADDMWKIVIAWGSFAQDSVGKQAVRAADSIGANIAEAYGRYHDGEKLQFFYSARGSLFETKYWLNRGQSRGLLNPQQFQQLSKNLSTIAHQLNSLSQSTKSQKQANLSSRKIAEKGPDYSTPQDQSVDNNISDEKIILFSPQDIEFLESNS